MQDLRSKTIRGGSVRLCSQVAMLLMRVGSVAVLARLLDPTDFGLANMVTALTGVLGLFRDFGLSAAMVQRATITEAETSALFWINIAVGVVLTVFTMCCAPLVVAFYSQSHVFWLTIVAATGFLFNAAGVQHSALLQRQMRFTALALIDLFSLIGANLVAILMAIAGCGYWALIATTVCLPLFGTIGVWCVARWLPGRPQHCPNLRSLIRFGGTLTLNGLIMYVSANLEKVLIGRVWGAEAIGVYGRACQLNKIPIDGLNSAVGQVAFSALSRLRDNPARFRNYFLKGYSLVLSSNILITIVCVLFAEDIIRILLGPKWTDAAAILRLLAPTILVYAMANPLGWLLESLGLVARGLKMALVFAPLVVGAIFAGLPFGPRGVALAYSAMMMLWVVPLVAWAVHGTPISFRDVMTTFAQPFLSGLVAMGLVLVLRLCLGPSLTILPRILLEGTALLGSYGAMLWYVMGQKTFYLSVLRVLGGRSSVTALSTEA